MNYFVYKILNDYGQVTRGVAKRPNVQVSSAKMYLEQRFGTPVLSMFFFQNLLKKRFKQKIHLSSYVTLQ